ncbi:hypothetical protein H0H93_015873, partial [Arthromyces matolae]
ARSSIRTHPLSKDVLQVAPTDSSNKKLAFKTVGSPFVDLWVPAYPVQYHEGDENAVDMWLAAVLRAAGVTASFVSWSWHKNHRQKPEPRLIKAEMIQAALKSTRGLSRKPDAQGLAHIPPSTANPQDDHSHHPYSERVGQEYGYSYPALSAGDIHRDKGQPPIPEPRGRGKVSNIHGLLDRIGQHANFNPEDYASSVTGEPQP